MKHAGQRALGLMLVVIAVGTLVFSELPEGGAATTTPLKFGMDAGAVGALTNAGVKPDYGSMWAGVWLQKSGWNGFDAQLDRLYSAGVTPAIHFYYWGNDISKHCLENGCWSSTHGAWKDKAGWQRLAQDLASHLNSRMKGRTVIIILETEFNKNDVSTYEALDGYLSSKAGYFKSAYSASRVVLGFGNWADWNWGTFDRAAATSHLVGVQGMRASTKDSTQAYQGVTLSLIDAAKKLVTKFGKGVFITDLALSSHWEPQWLGNQKKALQGFMDRRAELRTAGVVGVVYRGLYDAPNADTSDWYGEGERHFGLAWATNKTWKPAMAVWVYGVKAERGGVASTSTVGVEAERFWQKSAGGWIRSTYASGGAYWNLWSNGHISHSLWMGADTYEIRVRAAGTPLDGVLPLMKVDVDGSEKWRGGVLAGSFRDYVARVTLGAGTHTFRISFLNDAMGGGEDRNLLLDRMTLVPV